MVTDAALVVRPNMDSPDNGGTAGPYSYGEVWMGSILSSLAWRGGLRKQLYGDDAVASKFASTVQSLDPSFVVGMGHGNEEVYAGQYINGAYSILMNLDNADLMAGRVVYLLSCLTAQQLGPAMIEKGAVAYAGYNQDFVWTVSGGPPATDPLAAPFATSSTTYPKVLVKGKIVGEAKVRTIEVFNQQIAAWEKSADPYAREVVKWLLWDRDAFTVLGDEEARGLEPKLAIGLVISAVVAGAIGYAVYRWRRRKG